MRWLLLFPFYVCLIMNHGTIVQQNSRGLARNEFCHFCLHLFDYEPWNRIPQVIEEGTCDDPDHVGFTHGP